MVATDTATSVAGLAAVLALPPMLMVWVVPKSL